MDNGADGEVRPGAEVGTREAQGEGDDAEGAHGERPVTTAGGEVDQLRRELGAAKADIRVKDEYIAVLEPDLDEARRAAYLERVQQHVERAVTFVNTG